MENNSIIKTLKCFTCADRIFEDVVFSGDDTVHIVGCPKKRCKYRRPYEPLPDPDYDRMIKNLIIEARRAKLEKADRRYLI